MNSLSPSAFAEDYRIAVLHEDGLAGGPRAESIMQHLRTEGFLVSAEKGSDISNPDIFNVRNFEALLLPHAPVFPVRATDTILSFIKDGGDLILLGGHAFQIPMDKVEGAYMPADQALPLVMKAADRTALLQIPEGQPAPTWRNSTDHAQNQSLLTTLQGDTGDVIRIDIREFNHFDTFATSLPSPVSDGNTFLCFSAKSATENTRQMAVELQKSDKSRWIATVDLSTEWKFYCLRGSDFVLHESGNAASASAFKLQNAVGISFGLARDYTKVKGKSHTLWISDLSLSDMKKPDPGLLQNLPLFTELPPFQYTNAQEAFVHKDADWINPRVIPGPLSGTAAFAVPRAGSSQLYPLLQLESEAGLLTAAALMAHYAGEYANSQWLIFGPVTPAFYEQPGFLALLSDSLKKMRSAAMIEQARVTNPMASSLKQVLGVTHVAGTYHFTGQDFLNEGVQVLAQLGTRTIKLWLGDAKNKYPFNSDWPEVTTLTELASTPYFRKAFNADFDIYYLEAFALQPSWHPRFNQGISKEQVKIIEDEFYDLTRHLLTAYKGTGKQFVLQNWEGDWALRPRMDRNLEPTPVAIQGMIDWLNARQNGVNRAREDLGEDGVQVLHAAEMNLVMNAMQGRAGVVNKVIPHTNVDLISYSCYDTQGNPESFRAAIEFMQMNLPPSTHVKGNRVVIGEFGAAENVLGEAASRRIIPQVIEIATAFGSPQLLYWELYCNEPVQEPVTKNEDVRGYWLIKPDGSKAWAWDYFAELLRQ